MNKLDRLFDPRTIRQQANKLLDLAKCNQLKHFTLHPEKMAQTAAFVIEVMKQQYPELDIPYHSRWRHFEAGDVNRIDTLKLNQYLPLERGKMLFELVIVSVFLDAGAGQAWRYQEALTQTEYSRSEGLALASLALYQQGALSANPNESLRIDAQRLIDFSEKDLQKAFQITPKNPLEGVSGRVALLNRLGAAIQDNTLCFGKEGRLGDFFTYVCSLSTQKTLSAGRLFEAVLDGFNTVWPTRLTLDGLSLGDVWRHPALKTHEDSSDLIPFHKLSQWLTYSLIEPLEQAGIQVTDLDFLTGLPEYRNGGLLIDTGLLSINHLEDSFTAQEPGSELVVEWRALTVALLDELADCIRKQLHQNSGTLPLAKILQGGTWEAGRRIAREKRPLGTPPIQIISDGTVF